MHRPAAALAGVPAADPRVGRHRRRGRERIMTCADLTATFRPLDPYVGWQPQAAEGLDGLADEGGLRLARAGAGPGGAVRAGPRPRVPHPPLAPGPRAGPRVRAGRPVAAGAPAAGRGAALPPASRLPAAGRPAAGRLSAGSPAAGLTTGGPAAAGAAAPRHLHRRVGSGVVAPV